LEYVYVGAWLNPAIDAIVLAGDRGGSRSITGTNKNFLEIDGEPLLARVILALDGVARIERVAIVGPSQEIRAVLAATRPALSGSTGFSVLEQKETAYENFWSAFTHLLGDDYEAGTEHYDKQLAAKPVLVLPGDTPLLAAGEIDEFLDACRDDGLDYGVGMTEEKYLRRFGPASGTPGVVFNYLHLSTGSYRLNNLHFARPFRVQNRDYIERIYRIRYQGQLFNMLQVVLDILRTKGLGLRPIWLYLRLQLALVLNARGRKKSLARVRRNITPEEVTRIACTLLDANVEIVTTTDGRSAVDIDNETDYRTVCERFEEYSRSSPHD
jgi:GTP:adenosylcobinamide-phosphate guanylyltransferase